MNQYDPMFDLKINVGHCDLYFMGIIGQYDRTFDLNINVCHCDLYFMVH